MNKRINLFLAIFFCGSLVLTAAGCDVLKEKFSKEKNGDSSTAQKQGKSDKNAGPISGNTLAKIGNWSISVDEFNERLKILKEVLPEYDINNEQSRALVLEEIVRQQLFVMEAENTGMAEEKEIVQAVEDFRRNLIVRKLASELVKDVIITDEEVAEFYEKNKNNLVEPPGFHLREIVVETQAEANELLTELLGGADFAEVAKEKSISSSSANGGDIGFIRQIPFPEMAEIVAALSEGEVSEVVKGPDGFYIVKLEEKSKERSLPLEEIKEDLKANILLSKQQETIIEHINKLKDQFTVEVNEKLLK